MRVLFRPQARVELLDAQAWYEARAAGPGLEFARAFEAALQSAYRHPGGFAEVEAGCRRVVLRRFPYSVYYRAAGEVCSCWLSSTIDARRLRGKGGVESHAHRN